MSPYAPCTLSAILLLKSVSYYFALVSTLPPSVLPLCVEMNWCVSGVDHPSSRCLPTATLFPSCVAVFLCPVPLCLCLSLSPPPWSLPSFTLSRPLVSISPIASIPCLLSLFLLYPPETGLSGRFSHLSASSLMLFCLHACTLSWVHICTYVHFDVAKKKKRVKVCVCVPNKQTDRYDRDKALLFWFRSIWKSLNVRKYKSLSCADERTKIEDWKHFGISEQSEWGKEGGREGKGESWGEVQL